MKILLADALVANVNTIQGALDPNKYVAIMATTPETTFDIMMQFVCEVVILDLDLRSFDDIDIIHKFRTEEQARIDTCEDTKPRLIIIGVRGSDMSQMNMEGIDHVVSRPLDIKALVNVLQGIHSINGSDT
jgi:DNA-binding response OmpR family regulator